MQFTTASTGANDGRRSNSFPNNCFGFLKRGGKNAVSTSTGKPQELPGGAITSAEVLQAYSAAMGQLTGYRDAYQALVQYEEGREIVQQSYAVGGR